jgi:CubicO group peptidase (beta-lactamase class C family)
MPDNALEDLLRARMPACHVPGLSLATLRGQALDTVLALGARGAHDPQPVDAHTVFEAASLTKPLVAFIALQMVEAGLLDLDRPLLDTCGTYIQDDPRAAAITPRHVLTHTSGLPNIVRAEAPLRTHFTPGERFSYGSSALGWLQRAMEQASGMGLEQLAARRVFAPFGMVDSSLEWQPVFAANHAQGHDWDGEPEPKRRVDKAHASWSLLTTATDYARFLQAVLAGRGLSQAMHAQWFTPHVQARQGGNAEDLAGEFPPDPHVAWGLGWGLEPAQACFFHWGNSPGFRAYVVGDRRSGDAVVWFANAAGGLRFAHDILDALLPGARPSLDWMHLRR